MHYYLGADETQPAPLFVRMIDPSDVQKTASAMADILKGYFGADVTNVRLWHLVGAFVYSGPVMTFLQNMMALERERKQTLTDASANEFKVQLRSRFGYSVDDSVDYVRAFLDAQRQGLVPQPILEPWNYQPTSVAQDIGAGAMATVKSLGPLILGAVAVYALVAAFLPNLIGKMAHR